MSTGEKHTTGEGGIGSVFGRLTDSLRDAIFVENPKGDAGSPTPHVTPNLPTATAQTAVSAADNRIRAHRRYPRAVRSQYTARSTREQCAGPHRRHALRP